MNGTATATARLRPATERELDIRSLSVTAAAKLLKVARKIASCVGKVLVESRKHVTGALVRPTAAVGGHQRVH